MSDAESPVAASADEEPPEPRSAASVDLSGQIEAFAERCGTPLDAWQLWVLRAAIDTSIRQRAAQRGLRPFLQVSGI